MLKNTESDKALHDAQVEVSPVETSTAPAAEKPVTTKPPLAKTVTMIATCVYSSRTGRVYNAGDTFEVEESRVKRLIDAHVAKRHQG